MPATQRGQIDKLKSGRWRLRYYDRQGERQPGGTFPTKSAAVRHFEK